MRQSQPGEALGAQVERASIALEIDHDGPVAVWGHILGDQRFTVDAGEGHVAALEDW